MLGDYSLAAGSPAINYITSGNSASTYGAAPLNDFFENPRKGNGAVDAGAVEFTGAAVPAPTLNAISPNSGVRGQVVPVTLAGTNLTGATINPINGVTISGVTVTATQITATFTIASNPTLGVRNVTVTTTGGTSGAVTFTVTGATPTISAPSPALNTGGTSIKTGTITVSNAAAATGPLTLTAAPAVVKTAGPAAGVFSITGGTCASGSIISPGGSCTIVVQYNPGGTTTTSTAHIALTNAGATTSPLNGANFTAN
jgi:hypothetical protein